MKPGANLFLNLVFTAGAAASTFGATFQFQGHTLTVPDGFVVERVAGPSLVERPIVADFDEQGALYVAESSGSNDPVKEQLEERPHRILKLTDSDGDGVFDERVLFADRMMFPEGAMWLDGSLYVSAPPSIWKLTDTNGDGVADQREEWYDAKTLTGCANDLHGPYLGPDGWIYWCKGAFARQVHPLVGGGVFETRAAHIFRRRPEGGGVEPVMTGGMDNPVDVVFTPEGERIFTTTFFQHPGGGQRDGLVHAVYGGRYGKDHDVVEDHFKTGELMPVLTHLGPAAPAGLTRYQSEQFGRDYKNNLFAALFNLHKVTRHELRPAGATYRTFDSDFLVSDSTDFHPTDVIEDADGTLLVIDTGGWYKLCCPTSQLWKPDVLGAIYRVRRTNAPPLQDPRGLELDWAAPPAELANLLADSRPAVRNRAVRELSRKGEEVVRVLEQILTKSPFEDARRNAVWALTQVNASAAREAVRLAFKDSAGGVRHVAAHSASIWRDGNAVSGLLEYLTKSDPALKRVAAEALGRIGNEAAVNPLLLAAAELDAVPASNQRRVLEHSIIYALIEIANPALTRRGLDMDSASARKAALIALDQMPGGGLTGEVVAGLLTSPEPLLSETAEWIAAQHTDWGDALARHYQQQLAQQDFGGAEPSELAGILARLATSPQIQSLLATVANSTESSPAAKSVVLQAMARAELKEPPPEWHQTVEAALKSGSPNLTVAAVRAADSLPADKLAPSLLGALHQIAMEETFPLETRLQALEIKPPEPMDAITFQFLLSQWEGEKPWASRKLALDILENARLNEDQLVRLTEELAQVPPLEINRFLTPFQSSTNLAVGLKLVRSLGNASAIGAVQANKLEQVLAKYPAAVQAEGKRLISRLRQDLEQQAQHINELLPQLKNGDIRRGQAIFNSTRAACSSCHAIGYLGGDLGPDLTRIGQIRTERDLLEAVVYPSASFVRSYEPVIVETRADEAYSGILRKNAPDELVIATGPETEIRIAREDIAEVRAGQTSIMPQGLDQQLTTQELADLLAFLKATRW